MTLAWSDFARENLQNIYDRIFEYSPLKAAEFIDGLIKAPEILRSHPMLGRSVPEADDPHIREIIFREFRICYIIRAEAVYIASVLHGRQDVLSMAIKPWAH